ncbi:hypothetical protein EB796_001935 [Bugula neritina]|uniref:Uncharacterized protein n=1 Tax=Bugula neritina TaxID=10212 RepID=A0A7J7KNS1_BUGNE|nr:hypothetical protein EB796_001935 [Bugula neritina]
MTTATSASRKTTATSADRKATLTSAYKMPTPVSAKVTLDSAKKVASIFSAKRGEASKGVTPTFAIKRSQLDTRSLGSVMLSTGSLNKKSPQSLI